MTFAFIDSVENGQARTYAGMMAYMKQRLRTADLSSGSGGGGGGGVLGAFGGGDLLSMLLGGSYASSIGRGPQHNRGFTQTPQLSASFAFNPDAPVVI